MTGGSERFNTINISHSCCMKTGQFSLFLSKSLILLIFTALAAFLNSCENDIAVVNAVTSADEKAKPIESSKNVEFLYSDSARVRSRLKTPLVDHYLGKKPYYEMSKGLDVVFFNSLGKEETKITANYGIGYDNGNNENKMSIMEAKGNVIVINEKGDKLNTEHLIWNSITKKIYTNEFVKITTKDEIIWGNGMEANEDFTDYEIKQVKGQIAVKEGATP
ncbi:MAG: LPS export ABC transporter periplasmic protein LptC [Bacteroidia bacterium]